MALSLRRVRWDDGSTSLDPEDYQVIEDGKAIGRIYRESSGPRVQWLWSVYGGLRGGRATAAVPTLLRKLRLPDYARGEGT